MINISARKSEVLFIGRGEGDVRIKHLQLKGHPIKQVEEFTSLGNVVTTAGKCMQDIKRRRTGATRTFGMLKRRKWGRREIS